MSRPKRADRRAADRALEKLQRDAEKLWLASPGGTPERPIGVQSPSEVEVRATATPCPRCQSVLRVEEHTAETIRGVRLRVARVVCTFCRARRAVYFQLAGAMPS